MERGGGVGAGGARAAARGGRARAARRRGRGRGRGRRGAGLARAGLALRRRRPAAAVTAPGMLRSARLPTIHSDVTGNGDGPHTRRSHPPLTLALARAHSPRAPLQPRPEPLARPHPLHPGPPAPRGAGAAGGAQAGSPQPRGGLGNLGPSPLATRSLRPVRSRSHSRAPAHGAPDPLCWPLHPPRLGPGERAPQPPTPSQCWTCSWAQRGATLSPQTMPGPRAARRVGPGSAPAVCKLRAVILLDHKTCCTRKRLHG